MGLMDQAKPVEDTVPWIKLLLYSYPGYGKTTLAAEAPSPYWVDFERSAEVLRAYPQYRSIPVFKPKTMKEVETIVTEFGKQDKYETLVFDTLTRMQSFMIKEIMNKVKGERDKHIPLFQDTRKATEWMDEIVQYLVDMEKNVIFIAHVREDTNEEGRVIKIRPDLMPQIGGRVNAVLNVTGYLDLKGGRNLKINPTNTIVAKNRLNIRTPGIADPTLDQLFTLAQTRNHEP